MDVRSSRTTSKVDHELGNNNSSYSSASDRPLGAKDHKGQRWVGEPVVIDLASVKGEITSNKELLKELNNAKISNAETIPKKLVELLTIKK